MSLMLIPPTFSFWVSTFMFFNKWPFLAWKGESNMIVKLTQNVLPIDKCLFDIIIPRFARDLAFVIINRGSNFHWCDLYYKKLSKFTSLNQKSLRCRIILCTAWTWTQGSIIMQTESIGLLPIKIQHQQNRKRRSKKMTSLCWSFFEFRTRKLL